MHTIEQTRALCAGSHDCDPLYDVGDPDALGRLREEDGALVLSGCDDQDRGYADDLRIAPEGDGWRLHYRDPEGVELPLYGREWVDGGHYLQWSDLVHFVYCL